MPKKTKKSNAGQPRKYPEGAKPISFYIPKELLERLEFYVSPEDCYSMSALVVRMLSRELTRMDSKR